MIDKNITVLIGKAIREGKYLNITYRNKNGDTTAFWISILDINAKDEIWVNMFNVTKDEPILNKKIFISGIQSAEILRFSQYEVPENLIKKLENDESLNVYDFYRYDDNILNYYLECYKANNDPFLHKGHLIPGIDLEELVKQNPYHLSYEQQKTFIKEVYHKEYKSFLDYNLAISEFSIDLTSKGNGAHKTPCGRSRAGMGVRRSESVCTNAQAGCPQDICTEKSERSRVRRARAPL